jgi:hypothetical protein
MGPKQWSFVVVNILASWPIYFSKEQRELEIMSSLRYFSVIFENVK